ncbi:MAG: ABC transporter ATP-binding protein [Treponema sp.]|nr:ABC transporter ATP-binding protein [Treponema sp.]
MKAVLEIKNLNVRLSQRHKESILVDNVSFNVFPGQCLGILGESGSGKSMTMKAVMGILDSHFNVLGSIKFNGEELSGKSSEELRNIRGGQMGVILQNPMTSFDPLYRMNKQIAETFKANTNWTDKEIYDKSIELLNKVRIHNPEEVLEKYPHQLSGGMLQRVMIGIATAMNPKLIIADEPTTAIDAITRHEILNELIRIKQEQNIAMVFISHDLDAVARIADYIIVLNHGKLVDSGSFKEILTDAKDSYTKLLVEKRAAVMACYRKTIFGGKSNA